MDYCDLEVRIDNLISDIVSASGRFTSGKGQIVQADNELGSLNGTYAEVVSEINAQAAANPSDDGWKNLQSRMDKAIEHGQNLKTAVAVIRAAIGE